MLLATVAFALSAAPPVRITHGYTGKEARTIEHAARLLEAAQPDLLEAFDLALAEEREIRLEPHGDCERPNLEPFSPDPPYVPGTMPTVVLHPCDSFFRRKPEESAVVLGVELLHAAGLPDARDETGRRRGVSKVSGRIRSLLRERRKGGETSFHTRPARTLWGLDERLARAVLDGAMRRLRRPECQGLLTDFVDAEGRTLAENLEPFAIPPDEYLARIALLDGSGHRLCDTGKAQLLTTPNAKRIFVCKPFLEAARTHPYEAEVVLIHDMLHTLGLGENPPTSLEITLRVKRRCSLDED